jgi:WD40 repeat protein
MSSDTACPSWEVLVSFLAGQLPPERGEVINAHLESCPACEARAQLLERQADPLVDALRTSSLTLLQPPGVAPREKPEAEPLPPGAAPFRLEGYRIVREIGRGGMGVVYEAYQEQLKRRVAVKMILTGGLASTEERVRFLIEGELLARLNHPNFIQVHEVGTLELTPGTVQPYLVLEYVDGTSLKELLDGKQLSYREAAGQVLVLARAMQAAHAQGIIHRDLKPANVLLAHDGTLKITDFGLAKELGTGCSVTPTGLTIGTPSYMAPEQSGHTDAAIGPATDVYTLGIMLYEMLAGRPPFEGDSPVEVILRVLQESPPVLGRLRRGVPRDLETICMKCLEKEPARRYAGAGELADDLERWLQGTPIRARPAGRLERAYKWARRHPLPAALLAFSILTLVAGSAVSTYFGVTAVERAEQAEQAAEAERWERYLAEIGRAAGALQLHNIEPARRALEAAPAEHRNWEWHHFHSQLDGARIVLRGHTDRVYGLAFHPGGKWLASASDDQTMRLWDVAAAAEIKALPNAPGNLPDVHFSPDGSRLMTGMRRVQMWDAKARTLLWEVPGSQRGAAGPFWSPDGRYLAGSSADGRFRLWDAATGREMRQRPCGTERFPVAFSPDSRHVAAVQPDLTVAVWEVATGKEVVVLRGHESPCTAIDYSPDGRRIATGSIFPENELRLWDAATGKLLARGEGHDNELNTVRFSPDGRRIATGSRDQTVRLWDGATCEPLATLEGHTSSVYELDFSPDGARLVSASEDQTVRLWKVATGRLLAVLHGHTAAVRAARFSPDGSLIASSSEDHTVRLWDADVEPQSGILRGHKKYVYDVAFRPDGAEAASAAWDGHVLLWDLTARRPAGDLDHGGAILTALEYSPDGRQLAVLVRPQGVWLWDLATRKPTVVWKGFTDTNWGDVRLAFHPQGTLLAWANLEEPIHVWDVARREMACVLDGPAGGTRDVAFRPDGKQLAAAGAAGTVRLWDIATRRVEADLPGAPDTYRIAYSADGRLLAAAAGDKTVHLWEVETRTEVGVLRLGSRPFGIAFNPDGTRLACGCLDNTIRLIDVPRLREVAELQGHRAYVHAVRFSTDGTRLASASGDFSVRIWDTLPVQARRH